jgi:hypothetical protein
LPGRHEIIVIEEQKKDEMSKTPLMIKAHVDLEGQQPMGAKNFLTEWKKLHQGNGDRHD